MRMRRLVMPDGTHSFTVTGRDGPVTEIDRYLAVLDSTGHSPNTVRAYASDLALFFDWLTYRGLTWDQVTLEDLADYVRHIRSTTARQARQLAAAVEAGQAAVSELRPRPGTGRSASTAKRHLTTLFGFYVHLGFERDLPLGRQLHLFAQQRAGRQRVGGNWLDQNNWPINISAPPPAPLALPPAQVIALLDACEHSRDRLLLSLMWTAGLRIGQVLALRHSDINGRRGELTVVPRDSEPLHARTKRPAGKQLVLPLEQPVLQLHAQYMHTEYGDLDSDFIFVNLWGEPYGQRMSYGGVRSLLETLSRRTGIAFTPHQLRHSFATDLLRSGGRKELVQALLGHASIETTDMYDHRTVEDLRAELNALRARS